MSTHDSGTSSGFPSTHVRMNSQSQSSLALYSFFSFSSCLIASCCYLNFPIYSPIWPKTASKTFVCQNIEKILSFYASVIVFSLIQRRFWRSNLGSRSNRDISSLVGVPSVLGWEATELRSDHSSGWRNKQSLGIGTLSGSLIRGDEDPSLQ